jgi:hypothetical protein
LPGVKIVYENEVEMNNTLCDKKGLLPRVLCKISSNFEELLLLEKVIFPEFLLHSFYTQSFLISREDYFSIFAEDVFDSLGVEISDA